jgi:Na+/H+-dicarboxylate symporter|tara:strand:- start:1738 stop:3171 length:1434 start_codon:yes stop_codon:yes gene_type:complete
MGKTKLPLYVKIIIGLFLGIIWSFLSSYLGFNNFTINWIDPFGKIFIRLLKFIAVPLVLFSIISGISGLNDISRLGKMGAKTLSIYLITTLAAVTVGLLLGNFIKPGKFIDDQQRVKNRISYEIWASDNGIQILDGKSFLNDLVYAEETNAYRKGEGHEVSQKHLEKVKEKMSVVADKQNAGPLVFLVDMIPENIVISISNNKLMLQVIFFAIFFGITLVLIPGETAKPVISFFNGMNEVFLKMVDIVMQAAPFFVFALMAGVIAKMADTPHEVMEIFISLGSYSLTVLAGLAFMIFVFYPMVMKLFVRIGYGEFFRKISPAQFLAFSTSSSAATLPVTMECVEENLGVNKNVSSFVLPIGATVNMDGTSLYQTIAVLYLAQLHMVDLTLAQQMTIVLTATLASIGSAAVPSAGLVMLMIVLISVGLNPAWIAIIFPVDRILDMCRTVVNVTGDATVSAIVAKSEGEYHPPEAKENK